MVFINLYVFVLIIIVWAIIFHFLPRIYNLEKQYGKSSAIIVEQLCFLLIVSLILIYPVTNIDRRVSDSREHRVLAKYPALYDEQGINLEFGREFDSWLNDRFAGRAKFIRLHDTLDAFLNFGTRENAFAFEGKDGWLFYKGDNSVKLYQHIFPFTKEQLQKIKQNLETQSSWLKTQNIFYSVLIAPNKEDIYGEFYNPRIIQTGNKDRIQQLKDYLDEKQSKENIIYPKDLLLSKKARNRMLFWKQDTHWNSYGAYWAYRAWMEELKHKGVSINVIDLSEMRVENQIYRDGDLARMLQMDQGNEGDNSIYPKLIPIKGWEYKTVETQNVGDIPKIVRTICPGKPYKVVVFRDSFMTSMLPYVSSTFGEVIYVWDHDLDTYIGIIRKEKPDIILHEMVSRYAMALLQDTDSWRGKVK